MSCSTNYCPTYSNPCCDATPMGVLQIPLYEECKTYKAGDSPVLYKGAIATPISAAENSDDPLTGSMMSTPSWSLASVGNVVTNAASGAGGTSTGSTAVQPHGYLHSAGTLSVSEGATVSVQNFTNSKTTSVGNIALSASGATINQAGYYWIQARSIGGFPAASDPTDSIKFAVLINGTQEFANSLEYQEVIPTGRLSGTIIKRQLVLLAAGDTVTAQATATGADATINGSNIGIEYAGPAS